MPRRCVRLMTHRYYFPDLPSRAAEIRLSGAEGRHAILVMRAQVGDQISLFDGRGHEAAASIVAIERAECVCQTQSPSAIDRTPTRELHLGVALPKPDRARELVERLTELGVKRLTPLIAQRSQRPPSKSLLTKLQRTVIESCKQCGRNELMDVSEPLPADTFFQAAAGSDRIIMHPASGGASFACTAQNITAAVGPEGGWTEDEISSASSHGFRVVSIGRLVYRIETAAVVVAALATQPCDP